MTLKRYFSVKPCLILIMLITMSNASFDDSPQKIERFRRSPAFRLNKLSSITPPSLPNPTSMFDSIREEISKIGNMSASLEKALEIEKNARLSLQNFVDSVKDRIETLENAVYPDETNYWEESTTCGGLVVSQTGRISYKLDTSYEHYEKCVWTVRTNHRSKVKIQLISHEMESGYDYIAVTEVHKDVEPKSTKLTHRGKYVFAGPLLLITFVADGSGIGNGFQLEFEGIGSNINKDVTYRHFHVNNVSGAFSSENVTALQKSQDLHFPVLRNPTLELTTVVFNPDIKNAAQLSITVNEESLNLQPNTCDQASLTFYAYLEQKDPLSRCCGVKCDSVATFRNDDGVLLALIRSQPQSEPSLHISWNARTDVRRSDSVDTCGGTISGRHGRIAYKTGKNFDSNERCVWAIKPTGKSKIKVIFRSEAIEEGYDYVAVSTFDEHSTIISTKMQQRVVYNFTGPIILITFYSDASNEGKGFELDWEEFGDRLLSSNDPVYFDQDSGTVSLSLQSEANQIVIVNPKYLDGSSVNLKMNSFESTSEPQLQGPDSDNDGLFIFGNDDDTFSLAQSYSDRGVEAIPEEFSAVGGVFILLIKISNPDSITKIELTWGKGSPPIKPNFDNLQYVNNTDHCGGVLVGDAGHIEYKLLSPYEENARCTWVVESKQLCKLSFKLIKDGFESCCDFLILAPLNVETGTLGESVIINRENRIQSFTTPVVFIMFYSDQSLGHHGFRLDFTTSGSEMPVGRVGFSHKTWQETPGNVSFSTGPKDEENLVADNNNGRTQIVTQVLNSNMDGTPMIPISVNLHTNDFRVNDACHQDKVSFFQIKNPKEETSFSKTVTCSDDISACACRPATPMSTDIETFQMKEAFFIMIFKPLESNSTASFRFNWTVVD
ncbi:uncharacterized protein LOC110846218 isoform X3 [Folsomia candida]|uniref:uncharacterized protein LOC110846218 isoform X3 n=1 Tax=Folsomia candida TaxID=158441 RepID=UPI001604CEED|nr:uncharacterized protein LOC110846218 isoform X3 [Folsomia candida]